MTTRPHSGTLCLEQRFWPADLTGVEGISTVRITPDGKAHAHSHPRDPSDLYLVAGLQ